MKVWNKSQVDTFKYFFTTVWGFIITDSASKQIGAGVGLDVRAFHPDAEYIGSCSGCSMGVWAEIPKGTKPPGSVKCLDCKKKGR